MKPMVVLVGTSGLLEAASRALESAGHEVAVVLRDVPPPERAVSLPQSLPLVLPRDFIGRPKRKKRRRSWR